MSEWVGIHKATLRSDLTSPKSKNQGMSNTWDIGHIEFYSQESIGPPPCKSARKSAEVDQWESRQVTVSQWVRPIGSQEIDSGPSLGPNPPTSSAPFWLIGICLLFSVFEWICSKEFFSEIDSSHFLAPFLLAPSSDQLFGRKSEDCWMGDGLEGFAYILHA